ncbi:MAG TPA: hypothetical protein VF844_01585 [Ktedonobacteraceae bacterium]
MERAILWHENIDAPEKIFTEKGRAAMGNHRHAVHFGANVDPTAHDPSWPVRLSRAIEQAGLEYIGIQDHPYNAGFLDTWTLIATLLQATERVHLFPNVRIYRCVLPSCLPKPQRHWMCSAADESSLVWAQALFVRVLRLWVGRDAARESRLKH